ncbi:MAG: hypothetical protein RL634_2008, partial [Bacteroidota bacterium]
EKFIRVSLCSKKEVLQEAIERIKQTSLTSNVK